jgi:hypothetical protein
MKTVFWAVLVSLVLIGSRPAFPRAAAGGYQVVWDQEMKRPEAQKAIAAYVESHCTVEMSPTDVRRIAHWGNSPGAEPVTLHNSLRCTQDPSGK